MKKGYPEYKDTKFEWLGAIPSHWGVAKIGVLFDQRNEKVSDTDFPALSVTKNGIVPQLENAAKTDAGDNRMLVRKGDFVINSRSDRKGSSGVSSLDGSVSLISIVLRPLEHNHRYIHHLFRSYNFQEEFYRNGKGIVADLWSTRYSEMKNIYIPVIPMDEQNSIADYLDKETSRIDGLISEKQNFINLLKEKRQALISHVVTKGLDPDVEMKDSGVEWIGEIPKHWSFPKISYIFPSLGSGTTPKSDNKEFYGGKIPWVTTGELRESEIKSTKKAVTELALSKHSALKIHKPDSVIMAMYGATIGRVGILKIFATTNQACCVFPPSPNIDPEFLYYWIMGYRDEIVQMGYGCGQPNISMGTAGSLKIPKPSLEEQKNIVSEIKKRLSVINKLIAETERSIDLLIEQRVALISAAVTGKIDVRDWEVNA